MDLRQIFAVKIPVSFISLKNFAKSSLSQTLSGPLLWLMIQNRRVNYGTIKGFS